MPLGPPTPAKKVGKYAEVSGITMWGVSKS